jgi:hypothetical protein
LPNKIAIKNTGNRLFLFIFASKFLLFPVKMRKNIVNLTFLKVKAILIISKFLLKKILEKYLKKLFIKI